MLSRFKKNNHSGCCLEITDCRGQIPPTIHLGLVQWFWSELIMVWITVLVAKLIDCCWIRSTKKNDPHYSIETALTGATNGANIIKRKRLNLVPIFLTSGPLVY